jgi:hypothetical protein
MTTKPLHVAIVTGKQLRFFRSPNNDGRPDFPWHSTNDLQSVFGGPGLHARRGGGGCSRAVDKPSKVTRVPSHPEIGLSARRMAWAKTKRLRPPRGEWGGVREVGAYARRPDRIQPCATAR